MGVSGAGGIELPAVVKLRGFKNPHSNVAKCATLEWGTLRVDTHREIA